MMISNRVRVYIASPYHTNTQRDTFDRYLLQCLDDSISKGEAPYAPHIYLPQCKLCNDNDKESRNRGLEIGRKFLVICQLVAVYKDFGISEGMQGEMDYAKSLKIPINIRSIL
jgi:hypothetical protein